ncbi:MAG: KH domain-containing protein [Chloroflexi bacterium]|nr:KH domain-containing protein [Chloroflexota bacterium]MCY3695698.1 KH domain-containing protein [Chloroflexota bacterium]MXX31329.1 KH domain-containing protein [Chloroflexota bacterium]MYD15550.1 KH domain-containing protein [Chloroflexota bacterium]MYJ01664.1 KH domain-containing protein [Chloroflexota bacterium]
MEDFIEYVAKWMVDEPDAVRVERVQNGDHVAIQLHVHEDDMGRIIGREGRLAMALRTLLSVGGHARAVDTSLDIR